MAGFDFKKFLKEGIEEKKVLQKPLKEQKTGECPTPMRGCIVKLETGKCKFAKGCVNEIQRNGNLEPVWYLAEKVTVTHPKYFPSGEKADQEKRMRQSVVDAVMTIIDVAGPGGLVTTGNEMKRILLGLKYWKEKGKLKEIEMIFKQKWGIERGHQGAYPFSEKDRVGSGGRTVRGEPDNDGKAKCIEYGSCLAAFIEENTTFVYGGWGWSVRKYIIGDGKFKGILKDEDFRADIGWRIDNQEYKAGQTKQIAAFKKAQQTKMPAKAPISTAALDPRIEKIKKQALKDIAAHGPPVGITFAESQKRTKGKILNELGGLLEQEAPPMPGYVRDPVTGVWGEPAKSEGPRPKIQKITVRYKDKTTNTFNWPGTKQEAEQFFINLKAPAASALSTPDGQQALAKAKSVVAAKTQSPQPTAASAKADKKAAFVEDSTEREPVQADYDEKTGLLAVRILNADDHRYWKLGGIKKLSPNAKKYFLGGPESKGSFINRFVMQLVKGGKDLKTSWGEPSSKFYQDMTGVEWIGFWQIGKGDDPNAVATAKRRLADIEKNGKNEYTYIYRQTHFAAQEIKGGGVGDLWKKMMGTGVEAAPWTFGGTVPNRFAGSGYARGTGRIALGSDVIDETNLFDFEDNLVGQRNEKLNKELMKVDERVTDRSRRRQDQDLDDEYADDEDEQYGREQYQKDRVGYKREMRKREAEGKSTSGFTFGDYLMYVYGTEKAAGILKTGFRGLGRGAAATGRGALAGTKATYRYGTELAKFAAKQHRAVGTFGKGVRLTKAGNYVARGSQWFTPKGARLGSAAGRVGARSATSAGLTNLTNAAGASAGQVAGAVAVGAVVGYAIGYSINKIISGDLQKDRKRRLTKARADIKFAEHEMEVFCTGGGYFCGKDAPDGWQVKCSGQRGGYKYEVAVKGTGYDAGYYDPWLGKDREQTANSFERKDIEDAIVFLGLLYSDDYKNGLVLDHFEEAGKNKADGVIKLKSESKLLKWKECYKSTIEPYAETTLKREGTSKELKDAYKFIQHAFGLKVVDIEFKKGKKKKGLESRLAALLGTDAEAEDDKAKKEEAEKEKIKKVQEALVEFFGPESDVAKNMQDELKTGTYGINTRTAFMYFRRGYADKNIPTGKRAINKLPKYIREKIVEKEYRERAAKGGGGFVAQEGKNYISHKRLQKLNETLYKNI